MREDQLTRLQLSPAQRRLWFLREIDELSTAYHLTTAWRCQGPLDLTALRRAFEDVVRRHEGLRSVFLEENGEPYQVILDEWPITLPLIDASESELAALCRAEAAKPFDLQVAPAMRVRAMRIAADDHVIQTVLHH